MTGRAIRTSTPAVMPHRMIVEPVAAPLVAILGKLTRTQAIGEGVCHGCSAAAYLLKLVAHRLSVPHVGHRGIGHSHASCRHSAGCTVTRAIAASSSACSLPLTLRATSVSYTH